jgi:tetraacyldisaccharide 4'-kinase
LQTIEPNTKQPSFMKSLVDQIGRKLDQFAKFTADVIYDRVHGRAVWVFGSFLKGLSYLFSGVVRARLYLYEKRVLRNQPLGCLVVVVGNLTVGGTGKTPVVEKFARSLAQRGRTVAILSRGYKSKKEPAYKKWWRWLTHAEEAPPKIVSDGKQVLLNSWEAGDEPFMLARNLLPFGVHVIVDKDRVKAGRFAIKNFGVDTLVLDDGFQYLPLKGRLNLLLVDKTNPFGNGNLLPRGILREPIEHLSRASYVFITKSDGKSTRDLRETIRAYNPEVDIIECTHQPQFLRPVWNQEDDLPLDWLQGKKVAALSGIATPESFEALVLRFGAEIRYCERFLDHHRFSEGELHRFYKQAREAGVDCIVTTEKDAVRLDPSWKTDLPFYFIRLEIEILEGAKDFEDAVSEICFPKNRMSTPSPFSREPPARPRPSAKNA